ncbi:hypothetical protein GEMRC1_005470 [Eukaryota sp. GEM-RC1]
MDGSLDSNFEGTVGLYQTLSVNNSLIDVDISPNLIDSEHGIFPFSLYVHTKITAETVTALLSLEIIDRCINKCSFTHEALAVLCDLLKTSSKLTYLD